MEAIFVFVIIGIVIVVLCGCLCECIGVHVQKSGPRGGGHGERKKVSERRSSIL